MARLGCLATLHHLASLTLRHLTRLGHLPWHLARLRGLSRLCHLARLRHLPRLCLLT